MGEVLRASVESVGGVVKPVALKLVRSDLAGQKDFSRLFVEEMKVAMALSHGNVVQAFDVGTIDGRWFLAMELVEGIDLAELLKARWTRGLGPLPLGVALYVAIEALKGLDYAHRRRGADGRPLAIVHRDVSPGNLLLSEEGEVKVTDFGVAKSALRDIGSMLGTLKGKIPYMPPEQVRGDPVDRRVDIYAVGAVLYEMVAGRRLFSGSGAALIPLILQGPAEALDALTAPAALVATLERALATDPQDRPPTAALLRQELEAFAVEQRLWLSSSDLAAEVADARAGADERPSTPPPARSEAVGFDALLGRQLSRLAGESGGHSVYTSVHTP